MAAGDGVGPWESSEKTPLGPHETQGSEANTSPCPGVREGLAEGTGPGHGAVVTASHPDAIVALSNTGITTVSSQGPSTPHSSRAGGEGRGPSRTHGPHTGWEGGAQRCMAKTSSIVYGVRSSGFQIRPYLLLAS